MQKSVFIVSVHSFCMPYSSARINIEGVRISDVAHALSSLAGFPDGSAVYLTDSYRRHKRLGPSCAEAYHRETLDENRETLDEKRNKGFFSMLAGPDFIVVKISEYLGFFRGWDRPTDEYFIEFNERVDPSLLGRIKETATKVAERRKLEEQSPFVRVSLFDL